MQVNNNNSGLVWAALIGGIFLLLGIILTNYLSRASNTVTTINYSQPPSSSRLPPGSSTQPPVNVNCGGYEKTGGGNTATYSFTVPNGCIAVVQGVSVHMSGSYNWDNGGAGGLEPGSYTATITDGSYQITTKDGGQTLWCAVMRWFRQNASADSNNDPIDGWSSNCPAN